jgi:hypothetical protein
MRQRNARSCLWVYLSLSSIACGGSSSHSAQTAGHTAGASGHSGSSAADGGHDASAADGGHAASAADGGQGGRGGAGHGSGGAGTSAADGGSSGAGGSAVVAGPGAKLGSCPAFPSDDAWNRDVTNAAVSPEWTTHIQNVVGSKKLHPDYGNSGDEHYGIPINLVPSDQPKVAVTFDDYPDESDPGPYPLPDATHALIEGGTPQACDGDCHLLVVQAGSCHLFEGYACLNHSDGWHCSNGADWDLSRVSQGQRPVGYTSADAAGLPIAPGLVRYDEAQAGQIDHAIRFTLHCSRASYVAPATHAAAASGCSADDAPPMGLRVRLKANYDTSMLSGSALAVAHAMQHYGMILADNGSDFYFQGEQDTRWTDDDVEPLKAIPASAFEALQ